MLHAVILRSPHAHARIGAIDASRALALPGVACVVTAADLGDAARPLPIVPPHAALRGRNFSLLAADRTRFVGEAVAIVVAESRHVAEDAREAIGVTWEPLPAVQDPTAPGAAQVHDDIPDNLACSQRRRSARRSTRSRSDSTPKAACSRCAITSCTTPGPTRRAAWSCPS